MDLAISLSAMSLSVRTRSAPANMNLYGPGSPCTFLKQIAHPSVAPVEGLGVHMVQIAAMRGSVRLSKYRQHVIVIAHLDVSVRRR
jgi:hypothetical protein